MPNAAALAGTPAGVPPGFNGIATNMASTGNNRAVPQPPQPLGNNISTGGVVKGVERGGLKKEINSNAKTSIDNSKQIGHVTFNVKNGMTPGELMEWQEVN